MNPFIYRVTLRIFSQNDESKEICDLLGLEPTVKQTFGQPRKTPKGNLLDGTYDISYCSFRIAQQSDDEQLHEVLERTVVSLMQQQKLFSRIKDEGGRIEFFIGWFSKGNSGETLGWALLDKLAALHIDLAFDVYGEDVSSEQK